MHVSFVAGMLCLLIGSSFVVGRSAKNNQGVVDSKDILDCIHDSSGNKIQSKIGGPDACEVKPHSKPWMVNVHVCGGTLIAKNIVLFAKHCVWAFDDHNVNNVTLGDHDNDDFDKGERTIKIKDIVTDFPACPTCDYGILVFEENVKTDEYVQIANLPKPDEPCPEGKNLVACGWGVDLYNKTRNENTDKLWCVAQKSIAMSECPYVDGKDIPHEYLICTSDPDDRRNSPCHGDSGGPLTHTDENGKTTLYGVVEGPGFYPKGNCNRTEVFSRVSNANVLEWINHHISLNA